MLPVQSGNSGHYYSWMFRAVFLKIFARGHLLVSYNNPNPHILADVNIVFPDDR